MNNNENTNNKTKIDTSTYRLSFSKLLKSIIENSNKIIVNIHFQQNKSSRDNNNRFIEKRLDDIYNKTDFIETLIYIVSILSILIFITCVLNLLTKE